ncbi:hypothetical protein AB0M28_38315 [Streptomyces sp. NPDC051940]|uniref:LVIVD repeat-containing protein n=1 Tax=Streptomyces sp. NPDC051940 TaxID=3155675 RepID=UPI00342164B3
MRRRAALVAAALVLGAFSGLAQAHDQHGTEGGHLPAGNANVDLVAKLRLKNVTEASVADVGVFRGYAYLAAWAGLDCGSNGVHVVDVRQPAAPKEVAFIGAQPGSFPGEGIQTVHLDTPYFDGDVLVTNNERCGGPSGFGGMNLYDVTDPRHPTPLGEGIGDHTVPGQGKKDAHDIHSVFAWDAGDKAYAVIVDNDEEKDVDIVDITNPKQAHVIAEYNLDTLFPQILQRTPVSLVQVFLHDMVVKEIDGRQILLASYWDAGFVKLDVTDPLDIRYVGDTDYAASDPEAAAHGRDVAPEGNAHEAEFTRDDRYVIGTEEDFRAYSPSGRNETDGSALHVSQGASFPELEPGQTLAGGTVFVGDGCGGAAVPPGDPEAVDIAVVERGACAAYEAEYAVEGAGGHDGVLFVSGTGAGGCDLADRVRTFGELPTFGFVPRSEGFALFDQPYDNAACLAGTGPARIPVTPGTHGDRVSFTPQFDGWGYAHLYRNESGKMTELDTYAITEAQDPAYGHDFEYGSLTVHEVATSHQRDDLAYFSYYAGGFRVAKIVDDRLTEVGHYIDEGGNSLWGVQVFESGGQEYVAASDMDSGLYIFRYTGSE